MFWGPPGNVSTAGQRATAADRSILETTPSHERCFVPRRSTALVGGDRRRGRCPVPRPRVPEEPLPHANDRDTIPAARDSARAVTRWEVLARGEPDSPRARRARARAKSRSAPRRARGWRRRSLRVVGVVSAGRSLSASSSRRFVEPLAVESTTAPPPALASARRTPLKRGRAL